MANDIRKEADEAWEGEEFPTSSDQTLEDPDGEEPASTEAETIQRVQANAQSAAGGDQDDAPKDPAVPNNRVLAWSYIQHCDRETLRALLFRHFGTDQRVTGNKNADWLRDRFVVLCLQNGHKIEDLPEAYSKGLADAPKLKKNGVLHEGMEVMIMQGENDKNFLTLAANDRILKVMRGKRVPLPMLHFGVLTDAIKGIVPSHVEQGQLTDVTHQPRFNYQVFGACLYDDNWNIVKRQSLVQAR